MAQRKHHRYRCARHPERYPAVTDKCWECLLGTEGFKTKFQEMAEFFYQPGGPGYAGDEDES